MTSDRYEEEIIDPGDRASKLAKDICYQSHTNCPAVIVLPHQPDNFRGPVGFTWSGKILQEMSQFYVDTDHNLHWEVLEEVENDGAGGKPQFFTLLGNEIVFSNLGWEIITMTADDFVRSGRFPAIMVNEVNAKRITEKNFHLVKAMFEGYGTALEKAGLVNITGEIAIMKHSITAWCDLNSDDQLVLTWGGTCIGLARRKFLVDGSKIEPDMAVIGFWERGYRCNGGTFLTEVVRSAWGLDPRDVINNPEARSFVHELTVPSRSYAKTICRLVGWRPDGSEGAPLARIYGIAHITGGGLWGKFGEILPDGVGADLLSMPIPAHVLRKAQELSWSTENQLTDWRAHSTLHGGCGMILVCHPNDVSVIIKEAQRDRHLAMAIGKTTRSADREILVQSRFKEQKLLSSMHPE